MSNSGDIVPAYMMTFTPTECAPIQAGYDHYPAVYFWLRCPGGAVLAFGSKDALTALKADLQPKGT